MALFSDLYNVGVPTTSADLAIRVSDETGTGNLVFNTNPAFGGSILHNGVEHFTQSSPPSQRSDGSPLVDGDMWSKPTDNGIPGSVGYWGYRDVGPGYWVSERTSPLRLETSTSLTTINSWMSAPNTVNIHGIDRQHIFRPGAENTAITTQDWWLESMTVVLQATNVITWNVNASNTFKMFLYEKSNVNIVTLLRTFDDAADLPTLYETFTYVFSLQKVMTDPFVGLAGGQAVGSPTATGAVAPLIVYTTYDRRQIHP
jgi:hypothetical protein